MCHNIIFYTEWISYAAALFQDEFDLGRLAAHNAQKSHQVLPASLVGLVGAVTVFGVGMALGFTVACGIAAELDSVFKLLLLI